MGNKWTEEQLQAINLRNRSILVSAAAGSGKTAVLVERVIRQICAEDNPIDVDQILVVTFTKAAAAQMKERLQAALQKQVDAYPENVRYREQLALVPYAMITTIDSFCKSVVMDHFQLCEGLDPGFRVADEGECILIREEVLRAVLHEFYVTMPEGFADLTACFSNTRGDQKVLDMVEQLYRFSCSAPWPEDWLLSCKEQFQVAAEADLEGTAWFQFIRQDISDTLEAYIEEYADLVPLAKEQDMPAEMITVLQNDLVALRMAMDPAKNFWEKMRALSGIDFGKKPKYRADMDCSKAALDAFAEVRNTAKGKIQGCVRNYQTTPDQVLLELKTSAAYAGALVDLTLAFSKAYAQAKRKKNIVDFGDLEHLALQILVESHEEADGRITFHPSPAAEFYRRQFREVMVDEYQDSNMVQECILVSVSGNLTGTPNMFMVGDVKQSIYKFRMAKPALFMEKYNTYPTTDAPYQKVELNRNFRSSAEVLDGINQIFYALMGRNLGGIAYDDAAALHPGRIFPERAEEQTWPAVELDLLDLSGLQVEDNETPEEAQEGDVEGKRSGDENAEEDADSGKAEEPEGGFSREELTAVEWEARLVAQKIREIMDQGMQVFDNDTQSYRPARYGDIMIMLRTIAGWSEPFLNILQSQGIPAVCDSSDGYFQMYEIQILLNLLSIIDNPLQDIPLVAVAKSPIGNLTSEDLAQVKIRVREDQKQAEAKQKQAEEKKDQAEGKQDQIEEKQDQTGKKHKSGHFHGFWQIMTYYLDLGIEGETTARLKTFVERMNRYRVWNRTMSVHDLVLAILQDTQFDRYVGCMPSGPMRLMNIDMLLKKTLEFEQMDNNGLFQFIRYVEQLKKYEIQMAELPALAEGGSAVHIMSIHKSKGLEYPICILAGCGKGFNQQDARANLRVDDDFRMAISCRDAKRRIKVDSFMMKAFGRRLVTENLSEEQRILYVAMTRAEERLIMTGVVKKTSAEEVWQEAQKKVGDRQTLSYTMKTGARSYLDWLLPACAISRNRGGSVAVHCIPCGEVAFAAASQDEERGKCLEKMMALVNAGQDSDAAAIHKTIQETYSYRYPYEAELNMKANVSVSEIKKKALESAEEEPAEAMYQYAKGGDGLGKLPTGVTAAERGTAYHAVLSELDFTDERVKDGRLAECLSELKEAGRLTDMELQLVDPARLTAFFETALGERMIRAAGRGQLYREEEFILGLTPKERDNPGYIADQKELDACEGFVMLQGIIDAYFIDDDGRLVLMDYKTDVVTDGCGDQLKAHYRIQLQYYDRALKRIMKRPVDEWWLYSISLNQALPVERN